MGSVKMGWSSYVRIENSGKILIKIKNREKWYEIVLPNNEIYDPIGENQKFSLVGKASINQYGRNSLHQKSVILDLEKGRGKAQERNNWHNVEIVVNHEPDCRRALKLLELGTV